MGFGYLRRARSPFRVATAARCLAESAPAAAVATHPKSLVLGTYRTPL